MGSHIVTCHPSPNRGDSHAFTPGVLPVLIYRPRKDERLSWPRWLVIPKWFIRSQAVTHPIINRAQRKVTTLIKANALPLSQAITYCYYKVIFGLTSIHCTNLFELRPESGTRQHLYNKIFTARSSFCQSELSTSGTLYLLVKLIFLHLWSLNVRCLLDFRSILCVRVDIWNTLSRPSLVFVVSDRQILSGLLQR